MEKYNEIQSTEQIGLKQSKNEKSSTLPRGRDSRNTAKTEVELIPT